MTRKKNISLLLLSENDNVLVALRKVEAGKAHTANGAINVRDTVALGHKVARFAIGKGKKIIKYGVTIGLATDNIQQGEHVHIHNMKSNYTQTTSLPQTARGDNG